MGLAAHPPVPASCTSGPRPRLAGTNQPSTAAGGVAFVPRLQRRRRPGPLTGRRGHLWRCGCSRPPGGPRRRHRGVEATGVEAGGDRRAAGDGATALRTCLDVQLPGGAPGLGDAAASAGGVATTASRYYPCEDGSLCDGETRFVPSSFIFMCTGTRFGPRQYIVVRYK